MSTPTRQDGPSYSGGVAVTKSDATLLRKTRGIYVGGTGDVAVQFVAGETAVVFKAVPAGTILPITVERVMSTNTSATLMVALY